MKFAAVMRTFMLGGVAIDASNAALGAWLRLQSYAASDGIETPRLEGARSWNARRWLVACQLSETDVVEVVAAKLATWDGNDLVLEGFDQAGVDAVKARREGGSLGGRPRKTSETTSSKPEVSSLQTSPEPLSSPSLTGPCPSGAPKGAGEPDDRCEFHRGRGRLTKLPPTGAVEGCWLCKHVAAGRQTRTGEPTPMAKLVASS